MSLFEESDSNAGGDSTPPSNSEGGTPPAGEGGDSNMENAPEWIKGIEGIDTDLVSDPSLKAINNVGDLVKSYVNAQKLIGKDKVILPTEKSSEVEWNQFWTKMGKPEKAEDYKFELGEKPSFDENFMGKFAELANKHNILPGQAQALIKELNEYELSQDQNFQTDIQQRVDEAKTQLKGEWGDAYSSNVNRAAEVVKEFGGEEMLNHFKQTGYGSDPKFLQFLVKIAGTTMGEDNINPSEGNQTGMTLDEVERRINEAYGDASYTDSSHPDHKRKVAEVQKLFQTMHKYQSSSKQSVGF